MVDRQGRSVLAGATPRLTQPSFTEFVLRWSPAAALPSTATVNICLCCCGRDASLKDDN